MEKRIGFGKRLGAYLIDSIFMIGLGFIFASIAVDFLDRFVDYSKITDDAYSAMQTIYGGFADIILAFGPAMFFVGLLYTLIEGLTGASPGKMILGIMVGNQDGTPTTINKYMTRFAIKNINLLTGIVGIIIVNSAIGTVSSILAFIIFVGCFFVLGEKKLSFHDMIAKTAIYKKSELTDGSTQDKIEETIE